jgi:hypothetical protein
MNKARRTVWTPEMDAKLRSLWGKRTRRAIAKEMGLTEMRVRNRAWKLELPPSNPSAVRQPSKQEWIWEASLMAAKHGVTLSAILSGNRARGPAQARWEAFEATLTRYPHCSIAGLGRISGFHHATILNGLRRLRAGIRPHHFSGKNGFIRRSAAVRDLHVPVRDFSIAKNNGVDGLPRNSTEAA